MKLDSDTCTNISCSFTSWGKMFPCVHFKKIYVSRLDVSLGQAKNNSYNTCIQSGQHNEPELTTCYIVKVIRGCYVEYENCLDWCIYLQSRAESFCLMAKQKLYYIHVHLDYTQSRVLHFIIWCLWSFFKYSKSY